MLAYAIDIKTEKGANMINTLLKYSKKPSPYEPSTAKFWDDEHISKSMLESHLDQTTDAASRNIHFIEKSVDWISRLVSKPEHKNLLDLGCGPGLYTTRFNQQGFNVTGIDISKRSIDYAKKLALKENLQISYLEMNYLSIDFQNQFDVITLIYCDYAVLPKTDRIKLLSKIKKALKDDGIFVFDVFSKYQYENKHEQSSWYISEASDFWKDGPHLCLENHYIYDDNIRLNQYIIIDQNQSIDVYNIWDQFFDIEKISNELLEAGLTVSSVYADVSGEPYHEKSKTIALVVKKQI
jgi:SAM-dependent methyltransferase